MSHSKRYQGANRLTPAEVAARYLADDWLTPAEVIARREALKQAYRVADAIRARRKVSPPQI